MSKVYKVPPLLDRTGQQMVSALNEIALAVRNREKPEDKYVCYGFHINGNISDSAQKITYIADAVGMVPAKMNYVTGKFEYGSWENAFFMPKPCMVKYDGTVDYYLDVNDYTKKADGTASDIADTNYEGNAMMEFPKIWSKVVPDAGDNTSASIYFANYKVDEDYHCWNNIDCNSNEVDNFYIAIYRGSYDGTRLRSLSGKENMWEQSAQTEASRAKANNTDSEVHWYTDVVCDSYLIRHLLYLIGKSTDTQSVFGLGNCSAYRDNRSQRYGLLNTGTMNDKGLFWGSNISNTTTSYGVKVFGIENWWGNQWRRTAGLINDKGSVKVKMTYGMQDGSTATGYNFDGSGYIVAGTSNGGGWAKTMKYSDIGSAITNSVGGASNTYYCDYYWDNNGQINYALCGGYCRYELYCGASCVDLGAPASASYWGVGAALTRK